MTDNVISLNQSKEHKAFRILPNKKAMLTLVIHTVDKGSIIYPYFFIHPTKIEKVDNQYYTMNLLGGGLDIILHLQNFDEATYQSFVDGFAHRTISEIQEFSGDADKVGFPVISHTEKF